MAKIKRLTGLIDSHKASLLQEIQDTKVLKDLLIKGLQQPLTDMERRQVRQQLLDICLTIPALSLALGAPGGMVLLVVLYRVLPSWLIPTAFRQPTVDTCEEELFSIVDEEDIVIGTATRQECHGNPLLIHRVAHVLVFTPDRELILQKRAPNKDIQPGKWDTSVGGHLKPDENYEQAAYREMAEELGIYNVKLEFLYKYALRNATESENVATYKCIFDGEVKFDYKEITQVRAWSLDEIQASLSLNIYTPNFEAELAKYLHLENTKSPALAK